MTLQMAATDRRPRPTGRNRDRYVATSGAEHRHSIPSIDLDVTRTGEGSGPNVTISAEAQGFVLTSTSLGFPVIARTTIPTDRIAVARIQAAPKGSRWCGVELEEGTVLIYGPGADHTAVSPDGLSFQSALLPINAVLQAAEALQMDVAVPRRWQGRNPRQRPGKRWNC